MTTPLTGDIKDFTAATKKGVVLHNMPVYATADITAIGSVLNNYAISGKRKGSIVTIDEAGVPTLYQAAGSLPASKWYKVSDLSVSVTPA